MKSLNGRPPKLGKPKIKISGKIAEMLIKSYRKYLGPHLQIGN